MSELIELTKQLINCPSITPHDSGCQTLIAKRLTALGFHCEPLRFGHVDNLWAVYGNQGPLMVFAGHTDVVPTGPLSDWQFPPFQCTIQEGKLYGRGASDMKGALAAMIIAAERIIHLHPSLPIRLAFLITSDEEGPSIDGTQKVIALLQSRQIKINYAIIGEPSTKKQVGDQIRIGRRGSLHGKLCIKGKQGHVAYPALALNPIHTSFAALETLTKTVWDQGNEAYPPTIFQITHLESGTGAANVIPGDLKVTFNFRFGASTVATLKTRTEEMLNDHHLNYELHWEMGALPYLTSAGKLAEVAKKAIYHLTGMTTQLTTDGGTSDGRFIATTGAEVIELGAAHATAHQINEHIAVKDLETLANIYEEILRLILIA